MRKLNVLSLFNGMSFGMMALETLGVEVGNYYSSEIDKYANQATKALYPEIIQAGDVTKWQEWDFALADIDLLLAGFPCQAWSMAGKQKGDNDPRGALVHDLINVWKAINEARMTRGKSPVKFMFENVKMKKEFLDYINDLFGVEPVCINSALVSAQTRTRYYWTNVGLKESRPTFLDWYGKTKDYGGSRKEYDEIYPHHIEQPEDKGILLKDIVEPIVDDKYTLSNKLLAGFERKRARRSSMKSGFDRLNLRRDDQKASCLTARYYKTAMSDPFVNSPSGIRRLTPTECMRLQTVPEHHIDTLLNAGISNTQLYKMTGNGWTHDVIVHIFKGLLQ